MHEMGIAIEVYRTCRETVDAHGGGRLQQARLAVGELPDAGAELVIEWHPADQRCSNCGEAKNRASGTWMRLCPDCGMPLEVAGGNELDIIDLSFEAAEASG